MASAFSVADPSKLLDEARKSAFADARAKAELYATVAGASLDDIVSISESQGFDAPQPYMLKASAEAAPRADVPVATGELSFSINVSVQWELEDSAPATN